MGFCLGPDHCRMGRHKHRAERFGNLKEFLADESSGLPPRNAPRGRARLAECAAVLERVWDAFGIYVCGLDAGHGGAHRSRRRNGRNRLSWLDATDGAE